MTGRLAVTRVASSTTAAMAALVVLGLLTGGPAPEYGVLLIGVLATLALAMAALSWRTDSFEARLATTTLAGLVLVGQLLVATVGGPSGAPPHWGTVAVAVAVTAAAALVATGTDLWLHAQASSHDETPRHPYAL